jgi:hypothetical protein
MRSGFLAMLLLAAAALATPSAANPAPAPKDMVPSCAPLDHGAAAKSPSGPAAPDVKPDSASATGKSGAADNDDDDAKDFPPLKPGQHLHLIGFSVSGSKHIDEDALISMLPEQVGYPLTTAQIQADTATIKKALTALHVHFAEVTTSLMQREGADHCVGVVWDIQHIDAFSQLRYQGYWKFGGQTFSGNKVLTSEQLEKAIDLKPDELIREGAMSDAVTGMQQAYAKKFPGQEVKIKGELRLTAKPAPGQTLKPAGGQRPKLIRVAKFEWQIIEPSAK